MAQWIIPCTLSNIIDKRIICDNNINRHVMDSIHLSNDIGYILNEINESIVEMNHYTDDSLLNQGFYHIINKQKYSEIKNKIITFGFEDSSNDQKINLYNFMELLNDTKHDFLLLDY